MLLLITILGSLLLYAAWPDSSLTFLIFIAWIPMLWIEDRVKNWKRLFGLAYLHMLIWNVATTWWIWNASPTGSLGRSEEHTSELQSRENLVCRLLLEKKKNTRYNVIY